MTTFTLSSKAIHYVMEASLSKNEKLRYEKNWDRIGSEKTLLTAAKDDGIVEGEKIGMKKGIAEGEKIGMEKGIREIARKAKLKGLSIIEIADLTGLSPAEIEKIS